MPGREVESQNWLKRKLHYNKQLEENAWQDSLFEWGEGAGRRCPTIILAVGSRGERVLELEGRVSPKVEHEFGTGIVGEETCIDTGNLRIVLKKNLGSMMLARFEVSKYDDRSNYLLLRIQVPPNITRPTKAIEEGSGTAVARISKSSMRKVPPLAIVPPFSEAVPATATRKPTFA